MDRLDARERGRVLLLEVQAAADAGGSGCGQVGSGAFPEPAGEVGVAIGHGDPGLVIAGAGAQDQERHRPQPRRRVLAEVVELDQRGVGGTRAHDDVVLPLGGFLEDFGHGGPQLVEGAVAAEADLVAGGVGEGEVEALRPHAGEGVEHLRRWPAGPCFFFSGDGGFCFSLILAA